MKRISIREAYDYIEISEADKKNNLNSKQIEALEKYIKRENLNTDFFLWERKRFRIINYCGFISFADVTIEILPKTLNHELSNIGYERKALMNMLRESDFIDITYSSISLLKMENDNLLEIFAYLFSEKLKTELIKGVYKEYISQEDDLSILKGKLNFKNQIKNIYKQNGKVNCSFSSFEEDNLLNRCFYTFSKYLVSKVKNIKTQENLKFINLTFSDISLINLEKCKLKKITFNRNNKRFYESFVLLKKLFLSNSSLGKIGDVEGFSFLFEINTLFEAYIGKLIERNFSHLNIKLQDTSKKLLVNAKTNKGIFQLKPDIVANHIIIDTKWKLLNNSNRHGVCRDDLYQMYAYATRYNEIERVILLYPLVSDYYSNGEFLEDWFIEKQENKNIQVVTIDYSCKENTLIGLKKCFYD